MLGALLNAQARAEEFRLQVQEQAQAAEAARGELAVAAAGLATWPRSRNRAHAAVMAPPKPRQPGCTRRWPSCPVGVLWRPPSCDKRSRACHRMADTILDLKRNQARAAEQLAERNAIIGGLQT